MKTVTYDAYGEPENLNIGDSPVPVPGDDEVLVKIHSVGLNAFDHHLLSADIFVSRLTTGLFKPKKTYLGADIAGTVEAAGKDVEGFSPGDPVFGDISLSGANGLAEYAAVPASRLIHKPEKVSFEQAAALPMASVTALQALRDLGQISASKSILINGASGGVGTFAVQIAKTYNTQVTAVCSTGKMDLVKELDADAVIDYTKEDVTRQEKKYDIVIAANGNYALSDYSRCMTPRGRYVGIGGSSKQMFQCMFLGPIKSSKKGKTFSLFLAKPNTADLETVLAKVMEGSVTPVIDRVYPLNDVQEAFRYLGEGHAKGKILLKV